MGHELTVLYKRVRDFAADDITDLIRRLSEDRAFKKFDSDYPHDYVNDIVDKLRCIRFGLDTNYSSSADRDDPRVVKMFTDVNAAKDARLTAICDEVSKRVAEYQGGE